MTVRDTEGKEHVLPVRIFLVMTDNAILKYVDKHLNIVVWLCGYLTIIVN